MNFKEQLKKDLNVFINNREFAEVVDIDGEPVSVVIDKDLLNERSTSNDVEGLYQEEIIFHVKSADLTKPVKGEMMKFDNDRYYVSDVQENLGVITIKLGATMS